MPDVTPWGVPTPAQAMLRDCLDRGSWTPAEEAEVERLFSEEGRARRAAFEEVHAQFCKPRWPTLAELRHPDCREWWKARVLAPEKATVPRPRAQIPTREEPSGQLCLF